MIRGLRADRRDRAVEDLADAERAQRDDAGLRRLPRGGGVPPYAAHGRLGPSRTAAARVGPVCGRCCPARGRYGRRRRRPGRLAVARVRPACGRWLLRRPARRRRRAGGRPARRAVAPGAPSRAASVTRRPLDVGRRRLPESRERSTLPATFVGPCRSSPASLRRTGPRGVTMSHMKGRVLVVDDDTALAEMLGIVLRGEGFEPVALRRRRPGARRRSASTSPTSCCST